MNFHPEEPYNDLPDLPPKAALESPKLLKAAIAAARQLAELKGSGEGLPNQTVLVNVLVLQEAKLSSEIEGVVTSTDRLYRAIAVESENNDPHTKEVLRYRDAIWHGVTRLRENRPLNTVLYQEIVQVIKQNQLGVRKTGGIALADERTGNVVYTPPTGENLIRAKLQKLDDFLNGDHGIDPLIVMALGHYQFEAIHPFADGNGRTGRILNILYLLQQNLLHEPVVYLSRYIIQNKVDYYRLLREVTENQNWEDWVLFMLEAVRKSSADALVQVRQIKELMTAMKRQYRTKAEKIYRKELLELLFDQPYCTARFVVERGIAKRQTASKYLQTLADVGLLKAMKIGRETVYVNHQFLDLLSQPPQSDSA